MFKLGENQNVFLDNFCFDSLLQFESNPASTTVPANFVSMLSSLPQNAKGYLFFSILSISSLCLRICSPNLSSSSSSLSLFCSTSGLTHSEFPASVSLTNTPLLWRVREQSSKSFAPPGTVLAQVMLTILIPSPGNVT